MKGKVSEIFESVQGEGIYLGAQQVFVRLFGCNLKCGFCDTKIDHFEEYEPTRILEEIKLFPRDCHSVVFTGGEPLMQKEFLKETLKLTSAFGYKNYLETNGTLPCELSDVIDWVDIIAMDFKLPSSIGYGDGFWPQHREFLKIASRRQVFVKAVISKETTDKDMKDAFEMIKSSDQGLVLVLQPESLGFCAETSEKIARFKEDGLQNGIAVCIVPQIHKLVGVR